MANLIRRGRTWYARLHIPEGRWSDVGRALGIPSGVCRERVRTLKTQDHREAAQRRDEALAAMRAEVDAALRAAKLRPLTDWTAKWLDRALRHRTALEDGRKAPHEVWHGLDADGADVRLSPEEARREVIEHDAHEVELRQGRAAAFQFMNVALSDGLTVAEAGRRWLAQVVGIRVKSINGHESVLRRFSDYLAAHTALGTAETALLSQVSRQIAGEFLEYRLGQVSPAAVQREFSTPSGLWRWAVRRGYADQNPWSDMLADVKSRNAARLDGAEDSDERGFTAAELVKLLNAGPDMLAPNGGGYAATFYDLIRLLTLTGARPLSIMNLTCGDVYRQGGAPAAFVIRRDKTDAGRRVIPLHPAAAAVVAARLACLTDTSDAAPLWPEVPPQGGDADRAKPISTRFIALRRRILPGNEEVELYSFRRAFSTAADAARMHGGRIDTEMTKLLMGHSRGALAYDVYSDWGKLSSPMLLPTLAGRLAPLRAAVEDIVTMGLGPDVVAALESTANNRPVMVRTAPLFRRRATPRE